MGAILVAGLALLLKPLEHIAWLEITADALALVQTPPLPRAVGTEKCLPSFAPAEISTNMNS